MRRENEVTAVLDLTEEEQAVLRKIRESVNTPADAAQFAAILQLYDELQTTKRFAAQNPSHLGFKSLQAEQLASLKQQIHEVQPRLAAVPTAPAANVSISPAPTNPFMDLLQRGVAAVRDAAVSF